MPNTVDKTNRSNLTEIPATLEDMQSMINQTLDNVSNGLSHLTTAELTGLKEEMVGLQTLLSKNRMFHDLKETHKSVLKKAWHTLMIYSTISINDEAMFRRYYTKVFEVNGHEIFIEYINALAKHASESDITWLKEQFRTLNIPESDWGVFRPPPNDVDEVQYNPQLQDTTLPQIVRRLGLFPTDESDRTEDGKKQILIVVDLETTCEETPPGERQKLKERAITEIGAVKVDGETLEVIDVFSSFVQLPPGYSISTFCNQLTHISQQDVDQAPPFSEVYADFCRFIFPPNEPIITEKIFCSWGDFDGNMLDVQCKHDPKNNGNGFKLKKRVNLKTALLRAFDGKNGIAKLTNRDVGGLEKALQTLGMQFEGVPHRALTDAENTVRVLPFISGIRAPYLLPQDARPLGDLSPVKACKKRVGISK